jgi:citrate synthase
MGELLEARTAADRLGVDIRTLYAYVSRGSLRRVPGPDGRSSRYDSDDLELLAQRSRPRTLPRPAASIDLLVATRVSTVADGVVRYRGRDVLDLVASGESFERVADRLWRGDGGEWPPPGPAGGPALDLLRALGGEVPVLQRFTIAVAALPAPAGAAAPGPAPDWPGYGRHVIGCLMTAGGTAVTAGQHEGAAQRVWRHWSPLRPTTARVRALNTALVLLAEHELALSTLSVRVAASARATPAACVLAGLSTLSGALHGAAPQAVHGLLAARAGAARGSAAPNDSERVRPGFGHPVHRHGDPRTAPLLDAVRAFATAADWDLIERLRQEAPGQPARSQPNVDFALGALTYAARMPAEAATAIFAIARTAGWIAHAAEEYAEHPLRFRGHAFRPRPAGQAPARAGMTSSVNRLRLERS